MDAAPRIMNLDFRWLVMCCRLHTLADTVIGKRPPVPAEQEADGTQSGCGCFGKEKNLLLLPEIDLTCEKLFRSFSFFPFIPYL